MKKWIITLTAATALLTSSIPTSTSYAASAVQASKPISVVLNGKVQTYEQPPVIVNGSTLVPFRALFEALGAKVEWIEATRTVQGIKGTTKIGLQIGSTTAQVGTSSVKLEAEAQLINNNTMIPLRFVSEALGMYVGWDSATYTVFISNDEAKEGRTKRDIQSRYKQLQPSYEGTPFELEPEGFTSQGKLVPAFIQDGVKAANFVRYLANLPDDLVMDDDLNYQAQYGAVLLAANGRLSHTPSKPAGMNDWFYATGSKSTSSSNIAFGRATAEETVDLYMRDEDTGNMDRVGHRRWILNPLLLKVGFGFAKGSYNGYSNYYSAMQVFDRSRKEAFDYESIAWPNKGYFPIQNFHSEDPWSISLNPKKFQKPDMNTLQVQVTRLSDDRVWYLDHEDSQVSDSSEYFNVNTDGYGVPYCLIFRPEIMSTQLQDGEAFHVKIIGLRDASNNLRTIEYTVNFFSL